MCRSSSNLPQNEKTNFILESYGVANLRTLDNREAYNIYACGILFNHESQEEEKHLPTKKIVSALCRIKNKNKKNYIWKLECKKRLGSHRGLLFLQCGNIGKKAGVIIFFGNQYSIKQLLFDCKKLDMKISWKEKG